MEYSIRRYEAVQRLFWFLFFLVCLGVAYPVAGRYQDTYSGSAVLASIKPEVIMTPEFWAQRYWLGVDPLGKVILYLFWVGVLFLAGKAAWLLLQYAGKHLVKSMLVQTLKDSSIRPKPDLEYLAANRQRLFPVESLTNKVGGFPLRFLFHPYQRLRLMLANPHDVLSSDELTEKERRVVEVEWQVHWSSWAPLRWLLWILPLLALAQTGWLFYLQLLPALSAQTEIEDLLGPLLASLLPVAQIVVVVIIFNLASGLLRRLENLYLSNVDALFYDQFVSRVPFQSSDTPVILEALQKHFEEIHAILRSMEPTANKETETSGPQE